MDSRETEIVVVGGGPAGLIAAREAALRGAEALVMEEHEEIGQPCHCAGLLNLKGLVDIGVSSSDLFVQNRVRGAHFFSPSGLSFTVHRDKPVACVVDRHRFDKFLAQQATEAGVQVRLSSRISDFKRAGAGIVALGERESTAAKMIIDAEGTSQRLMKADGLRPFKPNHLLPALQFDVGGISLDPDYVEIHTGRRIAPDFFVWVIPLNSNMARVGLACRGANPREKLDDFVRERFGNRHGLERVATRSGLIVTCGPVEKTFDGNLLVVGDAAGQVKPTTGGGVILGGICASIAGGVAVEAVRREEFGAEFLEKYERLWKEKLSGEFRVTRLARRVLNHISDRTIDRLFKVVIEENLQDMLSAEGDIDFQSGVIRRLLKRKEILGILPSVWAALSPFK